jgi:ABC-2 type transport system ATP-binding protein
MVLIGRGRIVAQGDKASLLAGAAGGGGASTVVVGLDRDALAQALHRASYDAVPDGAGFRVAASTAAVSRVAMEHHVVLTGLRDGAPGLEDLFLELTSDTQRDGTPASRHLQTGVAA